MMRRLAVFLIRLYQVGPGRFIPRVCRFEPTCSTYAIQALTEHGLCTGMILSIRRLLRCHPFNPGGLDPVPTKGRR